MASVIVSMTLNNNKLQVSPDPVIAGPGDQVLWKSPDGDVLVEFPADANPFDRAGRFRSAGKGQVTNPGHVRADVQRPRRFFCTVTLAGHEFKNAIGIDTPGD